MTKTEEHVEFKPEGNGYLAHLNGCSIRLSQYDDGRWYLDVNAGYSTLQTNQARARPIAIGRIVDNRESAETTAIELANLGKDGILALILAELEESIRDSERYIEDQLASLAELDLNRAIARSTGFKAGFKAGQAVLRHIVWNVIGGPDEL
jgi:hypothetical protein